MKKSKKKDDGFHVQTKSEMECITLSWKLLEYRLMYYKPDMILNKHHKELEIPDSEYDKLERKYAKLCKKLKMKNSFEDMVGIDLTKPSVQLVLSKYGKKGRVKRSKK